MRPVPDLDAAIAEARSRLHHGLDPILTYHSPAHTEEVVVPAVIRLAAAEGFVGRDVTLLVTAAWFHDIGFLVRGDGHELIGVGFAHVLLPDHGYDGEDLATITGLILATRLPQRPTTALEQVICDADLDALGRPDFLRFSDALRDEMAATGLPHTEAGWCRTQVQFLAAHRYFTESARAANDARKLVHLQQMVAQFAQAERDEAIARRPTGDGPAPDDAG